MNTSYYKLLDIAKTATTHEIKKAYRKMALRYHPDRNKNEDAEERFKEIGRAYQVLSDPLKRREYDLLGKVSNVNFAPAVALFKKIMTDIPQELIKLSSMLTTNIDINECPNIKNIITKIAARYNLGKNKQSKQSKNNEDAELDSISKTLDVIDNNAVVSDATTDVLLDKESPIEYNINVDLVSLYTTTERYIPISRQIQCPTCKDTNSILQCNKCKDTKYIENTKQFLIDSRQRRIVFTGEGNKGGDIILNLVPNPHLLFTVDPTDEYNIILTKIISLEEFLRGISLQFRLLSNCLCKIKYDGPLFQNLQLNNEIQYKIIRNKGLIRPDNSSGDLKIKFVIDLAL